jgi:hypothetical protein
MKFLLLLLFPLICNSQINKSPKGTLLVALIRDDEIILAADSRGSFEGFDTFQKKNIVVAYIDSLQKIFSLSGYKIAITGDSHLYNYPWSYVVKRFNDRYRKKSSVEKTLIKFIGFAKRRFKANDSIINSNGFVIAGYEDNIPVAFIKHKFYNGIRQVKKYELTCTGRCFTEHYISPKRKVLDSVVNAIESAYIKCTFDDVSIGGPTNIIVLQPHGKIVEKRSFQFLPSRTISEYSQDILDGKVHVHYLYPSSKDLLFKMLRKK